MKKQNIILEIGAHNGLDGLRYALFNPDCNIYAFEPNRSFNKIIKENKRKIENVMKIKITNYTLVNKAVSNFCGNREFNISLDHGASSIYKFNKVNIKHNWGKKNNYVVTKKTKTKVTTLKKFLDTKEIKIIRFLHCDAQGSDIDVIKGLKEYKSLVFSGVIEVSRNNKTLNYRMEHYTWSPLKVRCHL